MASIFDWSTTAADNDDADTGINWAEQQDPDTVNNSARTMMQRLASWIQDQSAARKTSTGTGSDYIITSATAPTALTDSVVVWFIPDKTNLSAATLKYDSFPAKPLRAQAGVNLLGGEIIADVPTGAIYNSANDEWLAINSAGPAALLVPTIVDRHATGLRVGDIVLTLDLVPKSGRIRLGEANQTLNKVDYPELDAWAATQGYEWGSTATTFDIPSAAGYALRFAGTTSSIDPHGPRVAGSKQTDQNKAHDHAATGLIATANPVPEHFHSITGLTSTNSNYTVNTGTTASASVVATPTNTGGGGGHTPIVNISGSTAESGGGESRGKNVAMHADIIASAAVANADIYGVNGVPYKFSATVTATDPGNGYLTLDDADPTAATALNLSNLTSVAGDISDWIKTWDDNAATIKGQIHLYKVGAPGTFVIYDISGTIADNTTYQTATIVHVDSSGTFTADDPIGVLFYKVGAGATGAAGDPGIAWTYDTDTTMADPGTGELRINNAALPSVTEVAISYLSGETGNPSVEAFVKSWDNSTTLTDRGTLTLRRPEAPENFAIYKITSAITDNTTWGQFTVTHVDSAGTLTGALSVLFVPTGNIGASGAGSGDLLSTNNLSDVADAATARTNLGAGTGNGDLLAASNLSDVANAATARSNLGAGTGDLSASNNLSDVANAATARSNLGAGTGNGDLLAANNLSDVANAATARTNIGAGTGDLLAASNLSDVASASTARTNLGLAISTNVQAQSALLQGIADASFVQGDIIYHNGTTLVNLGPGTSGQFLKTLGASANPTWDTIGGGGDMLGSNNLSDVANAATARSNIGAGDVVGPASATANAVPQFDGATGKLLKDGLAVGTAANNLVQLNGSGNLPALNGAALTNLPAVSLNIVQAVATTNPSTTSTTYVDSGVGLVITPSATSSKILLLATSGLGMSVAGRASATLYNGAVLHDTVNNASLVDGAVDDTGYVPFTIQWLHSPASTSAQTYKIYFKTNTGTAYLGRRGVNTTIDAPTILTAIEILQP